MKTGTTLKCKTSVYERYHDWSKKATQDRKYMQHVNAIEDSYPEYIKNPYTSISQDRRPHENC